MANPFDAIDPTPAPVAAKAKDESTTLGTLNRGAGLIQRALINGVLAVPGMAMDAGVAGRNVVGDAFHKMMGQPATPDYSLPFSHDAQQSLTELGFPEPQGKGEQLASALWSAGSGSIVPGGGGVANPAPAQFVAPGLSRGQQIAATLARLQSKGFKVPPSTTNPTLTNRVLESVAGKEATQNSARATNDAARTAVAARTLNLNPDVFTPGAVAAVKKEAGQAWEAGRAIPKFATDNQYLDDLAKVEAEGAGANASFPGAANPDVAKLVDTYTQGNMTGDAGVSAVKLLRAKASDAFSSGNSEMGRVYKGISQAIEAQLDRAAQNPANGVKADTIKAVQRARQTYAKASLIEDSMLPDGTVSGPKLAAAWRNDEPITGELRDAAEFAAQYPKANVASSATGSAVHHLQSLESFGPMLLEQMHQGGDVSLGGLAKTAALGVAMPAARTGSRRFLMSNWGQRGALPAANAVTGAGGKDPKAFAAALAALQASSTPSQ